MTLRDSPHADKIAAELSRDPEHNDPGGFFRALILASAFSAGVWLAFLSPFFPVLKGAALGLFAAALVIGLCDFAPRRRVEVGS